MAKKDEQGDYLHEGLINRLAQLMEDKNLNEIEIEDEAVSIRLARGVNMAGPTIQAPQAIAAPAQMPVAAPASEKKAPVANGNELKSPMVGTAFLAPQPGAKPFVAVGDKVKKGQTLLIIEAMKVMNQIQATKDGNIEEILVQDGQPVEFNEALMIIS